jgi:putative endonuclease
MHGRASLGREGEERACGYLVEKGFSVIARNFRMPFGEIDIIVRAPDKTLVFVEVKTLAGGGRDGLRPEDEMSPGKTARFRKIALFYANKNPQLVDGNAGWRLDAVCLTKKGNDFGINHYENI